MEAKEEAHPRIRPVRWRSRPADERQGRCGRGSKSCSDVTGVKVVVVVGCPGSGEAVSVAVVIARRAVELPAQAAPAWPVDVSMSEVLSARAGRSSGDVREIFQVCGDVVEWENVVR